MFCDGNSGDPANRADHTFRNNPTTGTLRYNATLPGTVAYELKNGNVVQRNGSSPSLPTTATADIGGIFTLQQYCVCTHWLRAYSCPVVAGEGSGCPSGMATGRCMSPPRPTPFSTPLQCGPLEIQNVKTGGSLAQVARQGVGSCHSKECAFWLRVRPAGERKTKSLSMRPLPEQGPTRWATLPLPQ